MPHKKQKRSIRLATQQAKGYNNPPSAKDSLLPIATTSYHGEPIEVDLSKEAGGGGTGVEKKNNKRRKPSASAARQGNASGDLNGMSKSAYRILNADKLRQEYHAEKKRKREEEEALKNPNQKKKKSNNTTLQPLPYESLSTFNRRVEQEMRSSINSTIQASKNVNKKTKEVLKDKKKKSKTTQVAEDADEEWNGIADGEEGEEEGGDGKTKYGKEKKSKPTPEESRDPFAKQPKKPKISTEEQEEVQAAEVKRGRTGKTEFDSVEPIRGLKSVVLAPPTLAKPARKGLLAKALSSASDGTTAGARLSETAGGGGGFEGLRLAGMEEPVGKNRLPVDPIMKALLDREREKAVRIYRELKEQKFAEKQQ
ncbi:uncharacterized protein JCM6883_000295 [Sporobolomyces salmoneus]|uniref:uncharacterized protein n=1 Tax=Sporobolomyces salmoneus TaxID=183962 RepID=UPI00316F9ED4